MDQAHRECPRKHMFDLLDAYLFELSYTFVGDQRR